MSGKKIFYISLAAVGAFAIYNYLQKQKAAPVFFKKKLKANYNARTIPPFGIFISDENRDNKALIEHEQVHWQQYRDKGLLRFYYDYFTQLKKYGYDNMPMEKVARTNETEYCQNNYTACVRNGTAKTVSNPSFRK